jgi:hypothetical protein
MVGNQLMIDFRNIHLFVIVRRRKRTVSMSVNGVKIILSKSFFEKIFPTVFKRNNKHIKPKKIR